MFQTGRMQKRRTMDKIHKGQRSNRIQIDHSSIPTAKEETIYMRQASKGEINMPKTNLRLRMK